MLNEPESELSKATDQLNLESITDSDKNELLRIFNTTENVLVRNQLAMIFSKLRWSEATPYILEKIRDKSTYNQNGTLVFALWNLNAKEYFIDILRILCEQGYEARMTALEIIEKLSQDISEETANLSLNVLGSYTFDIDESEYRNSNAHFVDTAKELLQGKISKQH